MVLKKKEQRKKNKGKRKTKSKQVNRETYRMAERDEIQYRIFDANETSFLRKNIIEYRECRRIDSRNRKKKKRKNRNKKKVKRNVFSILVISFFPLSFVIAFESR